MLSDPPASGRAPVRVCRDGAIGYNKIGVLSVIASLKESAVKKRMRKIVIIDEDKCDGCGLCVPSCAEGAIQVIDGKARLLAENLCDGLGNCLGTCPKDAITIEERPCDEFDEAAVEVHRRRGPQSPPAEGCPGAKLVKLGLRTAQLATADKGKTRPSRLGQWPVQLSLLPATGELWQDADVLIAADCVSVAMPDFHERLLDGKSVAVACPKLDDLAPHVAKLAEIFAGNSIRSVTVAHMEVPCCSGIVVAVERAMAIAGVTDIPVTDITIALDGTIKHAG